MVPPICSASGRHVRAGVRDGSERAERAEVVLTRARRMADENLRRYGAGTDQFATVEQQRRDEDDALRKERPT